MREYTSTDKVELGEGNLTSMVWNNAERHPARVVLSRPAGDGWQPVTTTEFRDQVVAVAKGLIASGLQPGDRIGLMSRTRYEWTLFDFAIWAAGCVSVPIYETSSAHQLEWILSDSGAVACVLERDTNQRAYDEIADKATEVKHVWQIETGAVDALVEAGKGISDDEVTARRATLNWDSLATILYTSGTTGRPKGCELTHGNLYFDVVSATSGLANIFNDDSSTLLFVPIAHVLGRVIEVGCVYKMVRLGHVPDTTKLLDDLASFRPTFLLAVPRVFEKVYNGAKQKAYDGGKGRIFDAAEATAVAYSEALDRGGPGLGLKAKHALFDRLVYSKLRAAVGGRCVAAISGGGPLGARLGHFFRGIGLNIYEGYGLTESTAAATLNLQHAQKVGSVGRPIPGTAVRIADDKEILLRGGNIFRRYWNNPAATADALSEDGWFSTGDLGELDDNGYLTITGRKKEIIVTAAGKNVAPAVLEDRLRAHPLISQAMVVGDRKPFIACLVTIDPEAWPGWLERNGKPAGATVAELVEDAELIAEIQACVDEANKAVSRAESIRKFRILVDDFTVENEMLTPSLKVKRNVVMTEYAGDVEAIYSP
ncbi:MAG: AMP-dependent synthetase/ligase [Mycobacteriales bacterium]